MRWQGRRESDKVTMLKTGATALAVRQWAVPVSVCRAVKAG